MMLGCAGWSVRAQVCWHRTLALATAASLGLAVCALRAAESAADADVAWAAVEKVCQPPTPPAEWRTNRPSPEAIQDFRAKQGVIAAEAADQAKAFYTKYPEHAEAGAAREKEFEMTQMAVQLGNTNVLARLTALESDRLKDPNLAEDDRFEIRAGMIQRAAMAKQAEGREAIMGEFEKGARELVKEFPKRPEPYAILMQIAENSEGDRTRKIAQEVADSAAPDEVKDAAKALLKKMDAVGKPLALSFKAVDGREVDVAKLKGKVVLVDFWATWCAPCVAELPNVKSAYERLHPKGFEIVGISFDKEQTALEKFVADQKMGWPQFFDGKGWQNKFGQEFGINSIPAMWLVDKKGILRDMSAREDLVDKVEKLLAE